MADVDDAAGKPLPTIWTIPDDLWAMITPVLAELDPPHKGHRPRMCQRRALDGVLYHLRTGCQWRALPAEFGNDASVHRTMQRWVERGVLDHVWALVVEACDAQGGVDWAWQSADGSLGKARGKGAKPSAPTPRTAASRASNAAC